MNATTLACPGCGQGGLSEADFYAAKNKTSGRQARCKKCIGDVTRKWRKANPEQHRTARRRQNYRRKYGITLEDYEVLLTAQGGGCAGCGQPCRSGRQLCVDHDHTTGAVRGLLCLACNQALGGVLDNPRTLRSLAQYLEDSK